MNRAFDLDEVAAFAGITRRSAERAVASGKMKSFHRAVVRTLVREEDLLSWMAQRRRPNVITEPTVPLAPIAAETTQSEQPDNTTAGASQ